MNRLRYILLMISLSFLLMGSQCQTTPTVVLAEGQKASELNKVKDSQITDLTTQVKTEKDQRQSERLLASQAASGLKGIVKATEYMPDSPPKEATQDEAKLALSRLPPDDPAETVKALERVVLIVTGQRDEALKKYADANAATKTALDQIAAKDKDIADRDTVIKSHETDITTLKIQVVAEQTAHVKDVSNALAAKDKAIQDLKNEQSAKERRWWIMALRLSGLGCVLAGIVFIAIFKEFLEGGLLIFGGILIGLAAVGFDMLTAMWWFPYACGLIGLLVLGGGGWAAWHAYKVNSLHAKLTAALQDLKDESATLKNDTWSQVVQHLEYRFGGSDSFWAKQQSQLVAALGLVDAKSEQSVKSDPNSPKT